MKWLDETKPFLQKTLKTISSNTNTNWYVQTVDHVKNLENVNLQFFSTVEVKDGQKEYRTKGGALIFAQSFNGEIYVIITYPYVEEWITQREAEVITTVTPEDITEDFVCLQVEKFLDEMIKWQSHIQKYTPMGFRSNS